MYIYLAENSTVQEIIPDTVPEFPDVPIEQRYEQGFVDKLRHESDDKDIQVGMTFSPETGEYYFPQPEPRPEQDDDYNYDGPAPPSEDISRAEFDMDILYRISCLELGLS